MVTVTDLLPPRYRSVETIARGGMAEVYGAVDESLGREVAVKVLDERHARDEALRARFTREALAAARLSGEPYTVAIYDVGEWNGRPYIVMERAAGGTIADRMRSGAVEPAVALRWVEQAALALDAAHAQGVVHRDIKPANLLLASDGTVRVADFGIASAAGLSSLTEPGTVLGTLGYLAPEQAAGGAAGPTADRYSLAVVAYELLAGRRPHEATGGGTAEALAATKIPAPPISSKRPDLPPGLDPVFRRALAIDPGQRYPSCAELAGSLRRAFDDSTATTRVEPPRPAAPPRTFRRSRALWPALALLLLALAGAGLGAAMLLDGDEPKRAARPVVKTVTAEGSTVTVTEAAPTTTAPSTDESPPATTTAPPEDAGLSGTELNDAGYSKMQAGDYSGALPLFEQAVRELAGTSSIGEAYALYNLAFTRFALGSCDGVEDLLDRSEQIQGRRSEINRLRKDAKKACR
jgi:predicted Ser/Thr protein kinase